MNMKNTKKEIKYINYRNYLLHFIVMGMILLLVLLMSRISIVFCNNYATMVYPRVIGAQRFLFGQVALPWFNVLIILGIGLIGFSLGRILYTVIRYREPVMRFRIIYRLKKTGLNYACLLLLSGILFMFFQGVLYHRLDFFVAHHEATTHVLTKELTDDELLLNLSETIQTANELSNQISVDSKGFFTLSDANALSQETKLAFDHLRTSYPGIHANLPVPKKDWVIGVSHWNKTLVCSNILTAEVLYQPDASNPALPYQLCYETAKFSGFISSKELVYIANAACKASGIVDFQYSSALVTLHSLQEEAVLRNLDCSVLPKLLPQCEQDLQHIR